MNKRSKWMWRAALAASMLASASAWAADEDAYDFGGMYGLYPEGGVVKYYNNPATGAASCPAGYDARQVFGTGNVDWSMFLCTRPHVAGRAPLYDFGGMVGLANGSGNGALPWRGYHYFVNPFTHTHECPAGYQSQQVLGTPSVDNNLFYCYRPHVEGGLRMDFGGMTGLGAVEYPNPATGVARTCPSGYSRYSALGSPNVDYQFFYCGNSRNANLQAAGKGSLGLGEPIVPNAIDRYPYDTAKQIADVDRQVLVAKGFRPRVFRMWMLNTHLLLDENTFGPYLGLHRRAVDGLRNANITLVGVDNSFPQWLTGHASRKNSWVLPCIDTPLQPSAAYRAFLARYERSWTTIAREFPEIELWQIANETNGPSVLAPPLVGQADACSDRREEFTEMDRVNITLDLMFAARRGIKAGNPAAKAVMPPPSPLGHSDLEPIKTFIKALYEGIAIGRRGPPDARQYFDVASWHPYIFRDADDTTWVAKNEAIHDVLEGYNDDILPVILSEAGNSSTRCIGTPDEVTGKYPSCTKADAAELAVWMKNTLHHTHKLVETKPGQFETALPWLTYLIWFRMADAHGFDPDFPSPEPFYGLLKAEGEPWSASADVFCRQTGCYSPESVPF